MPRLVAGNRFPRVEAAIRRAARFDPRSELRRASAEFTLKAAVFVPPTTTYGIPFKALRRPGHETGKGVLQNRVVGAGSGAGGWQAQAVKSGVLDIASIPRLTTRARWSKATRRSHRT